MEDTDFEFDTTGETVGVLAWKKHKSNPAGSLELPYKRIRVWLVTDALYADRANRG